MVEPVLSAYPRQQSCKRTKTLNIEATKNNYFQIEIKFSWKDFETESSHVLGKPKITIVQ
jgi:hypothetical protein